MERELRHVEQPVRIEKRDEGKQLLVGYGAVWYRAGDDGTQFKLWKDAYERIASGAFARALREKHDVRGLFNHSDNAVLGRLSASTLRLAEDEVGLRYEIDLPDTQLAKDLAVSIERGDITGSSFSFRATSVKWEMEGDVEIRTVLDVDLYDVGPVTWPAYKATEAAVRSLHAERDAELAERTQGMTELEAIQLRLRELELDDAGTSA